MGYTVGMRAVEAIIDPNGEVRLSEPVTVSVPTRAIVTILEQPVAEDTCYAAEATLAEDWLRPEEEAAWAHLQPGESSWM